ncbi:hypothetical protein MNBD_IGNAVI01-2988 [hydrothermal vent metagenome]|uniref:Secretion system C-terminal sorting domain-containing protein n=1 Tax=hydrothermal vent metagenome TaxID=652676 RepID=A0A3B1CG50_9ZZZZ
MILGVGYKMRKILIILFFAAVQMFAQHQDGLMVMPRNIHFESDFDRSQFIYVENNSNSAVTIDSISYDPNVYFVRLKNVSGFPIVMQPYFEFGFEVIQYNYFNLQPEDSSSTITIYNTSSEPVITLETHHDQDMMHYSKKGIINGTVGDSLNMLSDATVYFFYDRIILIDSVNTDSDGNFAKELPVGDYFVAAKKDGYYIEYAFDKDSPLGADVISIREHTPVNLNFIMEKEPVTNLNVSGKVSDIGGGSLSKAIVVVRKGKHTPSKVAAVTSDDINRSYTTFTDINGSYNLKNIKYEGDYFVQVFAPFNIPGYYNENGTPSVFWQNADSVALYNSMGNINLTLERDSSYGAGFVDGRVLSNNQNAPVTDAIVYVRSVSNSKIYTYNFVASDGNYTIPVLPYGDYELIAQKIGVPDAQSTIFSISTTQDSLSGIDLSLIITSIENVDSPQSFQLYQNYPNPFNPATTIKFSLQNAGKVELNIYNVLGQKIATLLSKSLNAGTYQVNFNASNLPSGIYFYELSSKNRKFVKKMSLMK